MISIEILRLRDVSYLVLICNDKILPSYIPATLSMNQKTKQNKTKKKKKTHQFYHLSYILVIYPLPFKMLCV